MTRRIGNDKFSLVGGKIPISHIDRDPLLTLGGETVNQQRKIDLLALRAHALGIGFQGGELVLKNHFGVVEQPSDEGGLTVVYRTTGDEAQQRLMLVLRQISVDVLGDEGIGLIRRFAGIVGHGRCALARKGCAQK